MDRELIIKKIQALLHDPPEKALILGRIGHEERARDLMKIVESSASITDETKDADHIASAFDRVNFPQDIESKIDFIKEPIIVHPLSGKEFEIPGLAISGIDYKQVMSNVDNAIKDISLKYSELELKYLSLWAELQESIRTKESGNSPIAQLWELLPADTRIPDHSNWEHRRIASAVAGALPEPALLLFSIGPIQEFIATARKVQDLWSGSYILSYLAWTAMKTIGEEVGPDSIIFPDLIGQPFCTLWLKKKGLKFLKSPNRDALSSPTLPNRVLALLSKDSAEHVANKAEQAVKAMFKKICFTVKENIEDAIDGLRGEAVWGEIWDRQTEDFIEVYWAVLPTGKKNEYRAFLETYKTFLGFETFRDFEKLLKEYERRGFGPNIGTVYGQLYRFLEKGLGSRKTVRNFFQQSEPHYKCTMCGMREPIHPQRHNNHSCEEYGALVGFWKETFRTQSKFPGIKASERLCAVCVTKRFAARNYFNNKKAFDIHTSYPSTSTMATAAFKLRIVENKTLNDLLVKAHTYTQKVIALAKETALGGIPPMILGACKGDKLCEEFARLEGDWLYDDSLDEKTLWEEYKHNFKDKEEFNQVFRAVRDSFDGFMAIVKDREMQLKIDLGTPSRYYAIIQMDGDNMGKWLSGENAPPIGNILHPKIRNQLMEDNNWQELLKQSRPLNPSLHLATSRALRDFSLKVVREIVERDHLGKLIYAGGDDVLAFVSLKDLLDVMLKLRAYFSGALTIGNGKVEIDFRNGSGFIPIDADGRPLSIGSKESEVKGFLYSMGTTATASMGVAIVHHSYDLSKALQEARDAEKEAKNEIGRNAFFISLNKRSGGPEVFGAKWYYEKEGYFEVLPVLESLVNAFSIDAGISPRFAYDFRDELFGIQGLPNDNAVELEIRRIALRHTQDKARFGGQTKKIVSDLVSLKKHIERKLSEHPDPKRQARKTEMSLTEISKLMNIATFLARRENQ